jgi:imidazolonepropionase-like amidohydrolase
MKTALTACVLIGTIVGVQGSIAQSEAPLAFTNVSVVPMGSQKLLPDHTVVVANGRITAVGVAAETPIPEGAIRVDGRGNI